MVVASPHRLVVWFRNDLRLHDNPMLGQALAHRCAKEVLPCYIFDPRQYQSTAFGSAKTGRYRAKFVLESVADLRASLRAIGSDLLVGVGKPEVLLPMLVAPRGDDGSPTASTTLLCQQQCTSEELAVDRALRSALPAGVAQFKPLWSGTLYEKSELPYSSDLSDLPDGFTPFRNKVESKCSIRAPLPSPSASSLPLPLKEALSLPSDLLGFEKLPKAEELGLSESALCAAADSRGVLPFEGGETAALKRLKHYLWDADCLGTYFETRNGMLGADYSSKFSPWLAQGCLSARTVAAECAKYEQKRVKNKSTYWLVFELIWRDFYKFYAAKHGDAIFKIHGPIGSRQPWKRDPQLLERWKEGRTGMPLVDANMRELAATGFMSNRGRQNVASYLALDLALDWRTGADHFESLLIDSEVCANWGNWVAAAGLTGGRVNRFNIVKQSNDYDPKGEYIRHWIPELAQVPAPFVHEPWKLSKVDQERYGVRIGNDASCDYPTPPRGNWQGRGPNQDQSRGGPPSPRTQRGGGRGTGKGGRSQGRGGRKRLQHDFY